MLLFSSEAGTIERPDPPSVLNDRSDGGHLIVNPPREVWERSELTSDELMRWSVLVAATGQAMLDTLPALADGCLNYWEAGNWALNDAAEPRGPKSPRSARKVHLHIFGRSRNSSNPSWAWGEAPMFPRYADRIEWAARNEPLSDAECRGIIARTRELLIDRYAQLT